MAGCKPQSSLHSTCDQPTQQTAESMLSGGCPKGPTGSVWETSERVYGMTLRGSAAPVVPIIFAGLACLVSIDRVDRGALRLSAAVILRDMLSAVSHRR